jgi:alkaline phosphatase D
VAVGIGLLILLQAGGCGTPNRDADPNDTASPVVSRIAFGSCNDQNAEQPLWTPIRKSDPDLWVWLGDNIYADTEDMQKMQADYRRQKQTPGYAALREQTRVVGTWDDHDYGVNDGDRTYPRRDSSQTLFLDFLGVPDDDPRRARDGVYSAHTYGPPGRRVKVILLDTRYHKDPLDYVGSPDRLYAADPDAGLLGEAQWAWLENELTTGDAQVYVIGTSIQAIGAEHRWEKWADVPTERQRLLETIRRSQAPGVVLISGDRHRGELSRHDDAVGYPLYELTSSGMTHATPAPGETNQHRIGDLVEVLHFGLLTIDFDAPEPTIRFQLRGVQDSLLLDHRAALADLQPPETAN